MTRSTRIEYLASSIYSAVVSIPKSTKIQTKKQPAFSAGCAFRSNKFSQANDRLPAGIYPAGHHQLRVFLRFICLIIYIKPPFPNSVKQKTQKILLMSQANTVNLMCVKANELLQNVQPFSNRRIVREGAIILSCLRHGFTRTRRTG